MFNYNTASLTRLTVNLERLGSISGLQHFLSALSGVGQLGNFILKANVKFYRGNASQMFRPLVMC